MNLLFAIDNKSISLLLNCLGSVLRNGGIDKYNAYVLHSDLSEEDKNKILKAFGLELNIYFVDVPEELFNGFPVSKRYPLQIYYRLAAPLLLPQDIERILYLDVDTIVINSLQELAEMPFDGAYFMACTHVRETLTKINQLRLDAEEAPYINSGVLLMNMPLLREHLDLEEIRDYTNDKKLALMLPDQDILTGLYGTHVKLLDTMRYNLSDRILAMYNADPRNEKLDLDWVRKNAVIIHYFGKNKPWKEGYIGILYIFYKENKYQWHLW